MASLLLTIGVLVFGSYSHRSFGEETTQSADHTSPASHNCWEARDKLYGAWRTLLEADRGNVTLLGFEDTIVQAVPDAFSLRKRQNPYHLYRGTVVKYSSSDENVFNFVQNTAHLMEGKLGISASIEGTFSDVEGPHLLTANLKGVYFNLRWNSHTETFALCLDRAGYVTDLQSDENYSRWGQDVEALLAGAAVTALVSQLYGVARALPQWEVCPEGTSAPSPRSYPHGV